MKMPGESIFLGSLGGACDARKRRRKRREGEGGGGKREKGGRREEEGGERAMEELKMPGESWKSGRGL